MSAAFDIAMKMMRQTAQDAEKGDVKEWITLSGQPVPVKEGQTRKEAGQAFTEKKEQAEEHDDVFGEAFTTYRGKPSEAIEHLLREKRGHVPGAFNKEGLGDIDLPWGQTGKKGFGLVHIIERRNAQGLDGEAFARNLPKFIEEGRVEFREGYPGRAYIVAREGKGESVVRLDWDGKERKWLASAYLYESKPGASTGRQTSSQAHDSKQRIPLLYSEALLEKEYDNPHKKATPNSSTALDRAIVPMAFDRASVRTMDENGFMHIAASHITKATVNPYRGCEIPGWEEKGLDPEKIYQGLRDPKELQKSLPTWAGLPLHLEHHIDSAEKPQKLTRVGLYGAEEFGHCFHLFHIKENMSSMQGDVTVGNFVFPSTTAPETHVVAAGTGEPLLLQ